MAWTVKKDKTSINKIRKNCGPRCVAILKLLPPFEFDQEPLKKELTEKAKSLLKELKILHRQNQWTKLADALGLNYITFQDTICRLYRDKYSIPGLYNKIRSLERLFKITNEGHITLGIPIATVRQRQTFDVLTNEFKQRFKMSAYTTSRYVGVPTSLFKPGYWTTMASYGVAEFAIVRLEKALEGLKHVNIEIPPVPPKKVKDYKTYKANDSLEPCCITCVFLDRHLYSTDKKDPVWSCKLSGKTAGSGIRGIDDLLHTSCDNHVNRRVAWR